MSNKDISNISAPTGQRIKLADAIPLAAPLIVQIFDIYACNLACKFCHYGLEKEKRPQLTTKPIMELALFKKVVDEMTQFPVKIKMLRFCGAGESLLDGNIVEMVRYAAEKQVAEKMELITNAILLTPNMSVDLIEAGLERLRVSIYGLSSKKYREITDRDVDFEELIHNVRFFYEEKQRRNPNIKMYVKTMDCCLEEDGEKEKFIDLFADYCDSYAIETVVPNVQGLDYSMWLDGVPKHNALGFELPEISICPQPYHLVTICPDGRVVPCTNESMMGVGDCNTQSFIDIWNGPILKECQKQMIGGSKNFGGVCSSCAIVQCRPFPEDILDDDADRLKKIFGIEPAV